MVRQKDRKRRSRAIKDVLRLWRRWHRERVDSDAVDDGYPLLGRGTMSRKGLSLVLCLSYCGIGHFYWTLGI